MNSLGQWVTWTTPRHELKALNAIVRKIRLIQPMVITLKGGWIGWWSLSINLNYVNARDNNMQIYNKKIITYKLKEWGKRMQTQDIYSGSAQPDLCPLSSSFNPKIEVPLFQDFQTKPSSNTIGLWFKSTLLDFWLQTPFTIFKRYPTLEQPLKWYPILENS